MASQVLSGSSNVSYTNNTGQNVRIVINYMSGISIQNPVGGTYKSIGITWAGVSVSAPFAAIGRNLAFSSLEFSNSAYGNGIGLSANNALINDFNPSAGIFGDGALPTEIMLAPGQTFGASCGAYNIVVIPEAG
jgi:hypothetical protein